MGVAEPRIGWKSLDADLTLDDYLSRNPTTGLLIARGDTIFVERYQYSRTDRHRFTSWSMAKTVTAMLIGIAIDEGRLRSVDDFARCRPASGSTSPRSKLVMVNTAVSKPGLDLFSLQEMGALWTALVRQLGGDHP